METSVCAAKLCSSKTASKGRKYSRLKSQDTELVKRKKILADGLPNSVFSLPDNYAELVLQKNTGRSIHTATCISIYRHIILVIVMLTSE